MILSALENCTSHKLVIAESANWKSVLCSSRTCVTSLGLNVPSKLLGNGLHCEVQLFCLVTMQRSMEVHGMHTLCDHEDE